MAECRCWLKKRFVHEWQSGDQNVFLNFDTVTPRPGIYSSFTQRQSAFVTDGSDFSPSNNPLSLNYITFMCGKYLLQHITHEMHFYLMWSDIYNMIHSQLARAVFTYLHMWQIWTDFGYSDIKIQVKHALFLLELYPSLLDQTRTICYNFPLIKSW